jgi:CBS domain-containing protein
MLKDILNRKLVTTEPLAKVSEVARIMADQDVGCVLVVESGKLRGLITDRDIVTRCIAKNIDVDDCLVENVMTESLATVRETDGIFDCIETMRGARVRRIPVVDFSGTLVGIVSFGDILAVLSKEFAEVTRSTVPQVTSSEFEKEVA